MKSKCAVVFTKNNARVVWYNNLEDLTHFSNVLIGADLNHINGAPPHFWKFENGVIREMNDDEKEIRISDINSVGIENDPKHSAVKDYEARIAKELAEEKQKELEEKHALEQKLHNVRHEASLNHESLKKDQKIMVTAHLTHLKVTVALAIMQFSAIGFLLYKVWHK